jgi:DNA polymerase I-like protein with 3'-5' exonuclease and polymerase domains
MTENHAGWIFDVERTIYSTFLHREKAVNKEFESRLTYAVRCQVEKPGAKHLKACKENLVTDILHFARPDKPVFIFVMGSSALKAFGVPFGRYQDMIGKMIDMEIGGRPAVLFVSLSKRQIAAKAGFSEILEKQIDVFLSAMMQEHAGTRVPKKTLLDRLSKQYRFPSTIREVEDLVNEIVEYRRTENGPSTFPMSVDTETNTLYPHRKKLELLMVSVAWDEGKAATIPVEHPESPFTLEQMRPYLTKLLSCSKPKVLANAKYDLRVLKRKGFELKNLAWDITLGEHLVSEDKKGFYGLKSMVCTRLPEFASYEEELKKIYANRQDRDSLVPAPTEPVEVLTEEELSLRPKKGKKKTAKLEPTIKVPRLRKKLAEDDGYKSIPLRELSMYAAFDADATFRIAVLQRTDLIKESTELAKKRKFYSSSAMNMAKRIGQTPCPLPHPPLANMSQQLLPTSRVLADMELHGMAVNREYLEELKLQMDSYLLNSTTIFSDMVPAGLDHAFNPNSAAHISRILFNLGYNKPQSKEIVCYAGKVEPPRTDTGAISTNKEFLRSLVTQHGCEFSRALLEFRAISKARSTFIENIGILSEEDGCMHTNFHQHGTATSRLSSSEENMQNIPKKIGKKPYEYNIKRIFRAAVQGNVIVNADAKAAEVRVYAAYSKDKALIQALNDGMDPHSFFSSVVFNIDNVLKGIPASLHDSTLAAMGIDKQHSWDYDTFEARGTIEKTDKEFATRLDTLRKNIKRVVFGILYGAAPKKISSIVGIPEDQADVIIKTLFNMFPSIVDYIRITKEQVRHLGIVETFLGRRRHLNLRALPNNLKSRAERQAVNFLIQSTSAGMVLDVLCATHDPIRYDFGGHLVNTVHDSLVFEIPTKYVHQMPAFIQDYGVKQIAKKYPWMPVPFSWDTEVGNTYGDLMSIPSFLSANPEVKEDDVDEYIDLEIRNELEAAGAEERAA